MDDNAEGGGVSSEVMAGLQAVDKLWQRDRVAWPLEDIPLQNQMNSRLSTDVPDSAEAKKRRKGRTDDCKGRTHCEILLCQALGSDSFAK